MTRSHVLLPGAGLGAWVWDEVAARLEGAAQPVDLWRWNRPGQVAWQDVVDRVVHEVEQSGTRKATLVGHSIAGLVLGAVAQRLPDVVDRVVWVASEAPPPGRSFLSQNPLPLRLLLPLLFRITPKATVPPAKIVRSTLCNDVTEAQARRVVDEYHVMPPSVFTAPPPEPLLPPGAHRVYVRLLQDKAHDPERQAQAARRLDARVVDVESGHLAMLSRPSALASAIGSSTG